MADSSAQRTARHITQQGVALALLLWMLAALSLLVAGVMALSRSDVQLTALQLDQARAQAAATGIAHLAMRDLHLLQLADPEAAVGVVQGNYSLGDLRARATLMPASGLINLNSADGETLAALLEYIAGMDGDDVLVLAGAIVDWRVVSPLTLDLADTVDEGRGAFRIEEEVLEVPGMTRDIYEHIRRYVHTQPTGAQLELLDSPDSLLDALRYASPDAVDFALESRQDGGRAAAPLPGPALPPGMAASSVYCVEVDVQIAEGRVFRQRIWVDMGGGTATLPWRFSRVYPVMLLPMNSEEA